MECDTIVDEDNHFRAPIIKTFRRKSPFRLLLSHMGKVCECGDVLKDELERYYRGDFSTIEETAKTISKLEHEADLIKSNIRNHLPNSIFMPVDKGKFLRVVSEQDAILDHAENLANLLYMRHTKIPKKLQDTFCEHALYVNQTLKAMEEAVGGICDLVESGFVKRRREESKKQIYKVHEKEYRADKERYLLNQGIYEMEKKLEPMDVYHLLKIVDWVDDIADHAENVADWLRAMIAK